jgi:NDP-sugar pyrophosphorylase family protein
MQALILAGGKGTRLRPLTLYTPKPVVPVVNRPFLLYQLEVLERAGVKDITLSLSYQPGKIEDVLGSCLKPGVNLRFVTEPSPMGTGGAYKYAADTIKETTIVFNGDILTDIDVSAMLDRHRKSGAEATIALYPVEDPSAYGLVETDGSGRVLRFLEKPTPEVMASLDVNTVNAGVYILEPSILDLIPANENRSFEYNVFPDILEQQRPFCAYVLDKNYWRDIGTPASYLEAHHDFLSGKIRGFSMETSGASDVATAAVIDRSSVIAEGCTIKPNAKIINSVLGPGVQVEERALVENSVIWSHTRVSAGAEVSGAVIARSCYIGRSVVVSEGAVLGDKSTIPDYSRI